MWCENCNYGSSTMKIINVDQFKCPQCGNRTLIGKMPFPSKPQRIIGKKANTVSKHVDG